MEQIYKKINNHEYLNNEDIKRIISIESNSKIKALFVDYEAGGKSFHENDSTIRIDKKDNFKTLMCFIDSANLKLRIKNLNNPSSFLVDSYNLYLLFELFHELEHVKQLEKCKKNDDSQNELIKKTYDYGRRSYDIYNKYHDLFYFEYQAVIIPFIKILDLIDNEFTNLDKRSIIEFNKRIAGIIYHSYGNKSLYEESKIYNKFCSPICYTKFLSKFWSTPDEKKININTYR